jgi:chromosomal replication initiation ATPase DnaA
MSLLQSLDKTTTRCPLHDAKHVCRLLQVATASAFGVPVDEMRARSRRAAGVAFARQSAMYLAHVVLGLNYSATGSLFRRDRTTAAHACQRVEDRRDDPEIDRLLQMLEGVCSELARGAMPRSDVRP